MYIVVLRFWSSSYCRTAEIFEAKKPNKIVNKFKLVLLFQVRYIEGTAELLDLPELQIITDTSPIKTCLMTKWPTVELSWKGGVIPSLNWFITHLLFLKEYCIKANNYEVCASPDYYQSIVFSMFRIDIW